MVPLFTQLHKRYPCLGSVFVPTAVLVLLFGGSCIAMYLTGVRGVPTSRKSIIGNCVLFGVAALASGVLWMPILNAHLDLRSARVIEGEIIVIDSPGRGGPTRRIVAEVDGTKLTGSFYAQTLYWEVPVVRNGGAAKLTVGRGLFGVPWVAKIEQP